MNERGIPRISRSGGVDPLGGDVDLRRGCFSQKMYAKMKELGPVGDVLRARPLDPPVIQSNWSRLESLGFCFSLDQYIKS